MIEYVLEIIGEDRDLMIENDRGLEIIGKDRDLMIRNEDRGMIMITGIK